MNFKNYVQQPVTNYAALPTEFLGRLWAYLIAYCFNLDTTAKYGPYKMYGPYRFGDPVGIRTLDLLIRSQSLYPAELPSHDEEYSSPELLPLRFWQGQKESNPQPTVLETATLPVELYPYEREERT